MKIINRLMKPFKGRSKGLGATDLVWFGVMMIFSFTMIVYTTLYHFHNDYTKLVDSVANSMLDAIQENREVTAGMVNHYKEDLNRMTYYINDYEIRIYKVNFTATGSSYSKVAKATKETYQSLGSTKFNRGDIVRIEINSTGESRLGQMFQMLLGSDYDSSKGTKVVGFSEGGVD